MNKIEICKLAIIVLLPLLVGCVGYPNQYGFRYPVHIPYGNYGYGYGYGYNGYGNYQGGYQPRFRGWGGDRDGWGNGGYRRYHDDD